MNTQQQHEALSIFAAKFGFTVHLHTPEDKRKNTTFFLQDGNQSISPKLDYMNLQHFLLGYNRAILKLTNKNS